MTVRSLLLSRAGELADHDGVPVSILHVQAAADGLVKEILRERDQGLARLVASDAASPTQGPVQEPAKQPQKAAGPKAPPAPIMKSASAKGGPQ